MFTCYVYWIHLKGQSWDEGYIGVSIDPARRYEEHKSYTDTILAEAIKKHGNDLIYETIYCGTEDSCYSLEKSLRPNPYTGWNKARGGRYCPSETLRGIKKSTPAWNKGKKVPRTKAEAEHRLNQWKTKMESGYQHPNRNTVGRPSTKKGKHYPHLQGGINYGTSKEWTIQNTITGDTFTVVSLRNWAKQLAESTGKKFNTIDTYIRKYQQYDNYKII